MKVFEKYLIPIIAKYKKKLTIRLNVYYPYNLEETKL
jgi:hypothetical protein